MRAVAERLGVAPMTLYTYVPTKAELIDVMVDTVYRELPLPDLTNRPWRARVETVARDNRALLDRRPWMAQVSAVRPPLGPGVLAKYEQELRAFEGLGLTDVEMDLALSHVLAFVQAAARVAAEVRRAQAAMVDEQWWAEVAPLLEKVFDPDRYPVAARVGQAAGEEYNAAYSPDRAYEFGLARLLDGLGVLIEARGSRHADPLCDNAGDAYQCDAAPTPAWRGDRPSPRWHAPEPPDSRA
jgi:AcrR family transcriptional regulator